MDGCTLPCQSKFACPAKRCDYIDTPLLGAHAHEVPTISQAPQRTRKATKTNGPWMHTLEVSRGKNRRRDDQVILDTQQSGGGHTVSR